MVAGATYAVGNVYPALGGYVIAASPDGLHGLVVATNDTFTTANYYITTRYLSDPTNQLPAGTAGTQQYFRDWRVPTFYELQQLIFPNRAAIGNFNDGIDYWTSTGASSNSNATLTWPGGLTSGQNTSTYTGRCRPVRSF